MSQKHSLIKLPKMVPYGAALQVMGERAADAGIVCQAVAAKREALEIALVHDDETNKSVRWDSLGIALSQLGEITQVPAALKEAVEAWQPP